MKIKTKIGFSFFLLAFVSSSLLLLVVYSIAKRNIKEDIYSHLATTAQSRADHVETLLKGYKDTVTQLAQRNSFKNLLLDNVDSHDYNKVFKNTVQELKQIAEIDGGIAEVFLINTQGTTIASSDETKIGLDKSSDLYFINAKEKAYIKDVYHSKTVDEHIITASAPIKDKTTNTLTGVAVIRIKIDTLVKIVTDTTGMGQTGEIYIVNNQGYMITPTRFDKSTFLERKVDVESMRNSHPVDTTADDPQWHQKTVVYYDYRGEKNLGTKVYLPQMQWTLIAEIDTAEAFAPLAKLSFFSAIIFCSILIAVWVISFAISKRITKPIHILQKGAEIFGSGNLDYKVSISGKDEIAQLSRTFNSMIEDLKKTTASRDELNEANQMLRDFVYVASHDLREPLRKISSFGSLLQNSLQDTLSADDTENLDFMIDGANRMTIMIEGLLAYSRLDTKGLSFEDVDLNEVVGHLKKLELAAILEETDAVIEIPEPLPTVHCGIAQIMELMQNLIANGIKYHLPDVQPHITITAENIADDQVRINIQDNGIGIDEQYKDEIFKMFRRLHTKQQYPGTGIGLAVCKKIIEKHNGQIGIDSKPGCGSTFWFTMKSVSCLQMAAV